MARRSIRISWVMALSAVLSSAVMGGCAAGSTDESGTPDVDITDGWVDTGDDESGAETAVDSGDDTTIADSAGDGSSGDGGDGGDASDGSSDASCDPDAGLTISCGVGECTVTVDACGEGGVATTCKPKDPGVEVCNGKDDDCDGKVDEDLGETTCGTGECQRTQKNCVDGTPKTCAAGTPGTEICNGKDDDCNGSVDDLGTTTCGVGECKITINKCESGSPTTCMPKTASPEICDGKDNDCDGATDEDLAPLSCGVGECAKTIPACIGGAPQFCVPGTPGLEVCDGKDNDCDGTVDNGLGTISCGVGACSATVPACVSGKPGVCVAGTSKPEVCNGIDDDCSGAADDGLPILNCGVGECKNTVASCVSGMSQTCTPKAGSPEICDGKDNDCSGAADDGVPSVMCPPPAHTAATACASGSCKTAGCSTGYVDVDGDFGDGCECADSNLPHSCVLVGGSAGDLGTLGVGSNISVTHNNPIVGREDWYQVTFLDVKTKTLSHPRINFTVNPLTGSDKTFQFDVIYGSCASPGAPTKCKDTGGNSTALQSFETYYLSGLPGDPLTSTWIPIMSTTEGGVSAYTPAAATYTTVFIRVTYAGTAATCSPYTLFVAN